RTTRCDREAQRVVRGALALVATCATFGAVSPAVALGDVSPEATLADRYSPVVRLVAQTEECGAGEPYTPIDVDAVDRRVRLRSEEHTSELQSRQYLVCR